MHKLIDKQKIKHQHHCKKFIGTVEGVGICVECGKTVVWNKEKALRVATQRLEVISVNQRGRQK